MLNWHDLLQRMIRCDGVETYVNQSSRIFHWYLVEAPLAPNSTSPTDHQMRKYARKTVRFASQRIRAMALVTLDVSKLADVALACLDGTPESTGYWVELLSFRCLQVRLTPSCVHRCTEMICLRQGPGGAD